MATLRGAMVNDQARDQLPDFIQARLQAGTSERLASDAALRAGLATSLPMGMVICRRVIGVPVLVRLQLAQDVQVETVEFHLCFRWLARRQIVLYGRRPIVV